MTDPTSFGTGGLPAELKGDNKTENTSTLPMSPPSGGCLILGRRRSCWIRRCRWHLSRCRLPFASRRKPPNLLVPSVLQRSLRLSHQKVSAFPLGGAPP